MGVRETSFKELLELLELVFHSRNIRFENGSSLTCDGMVQDYPVLNDEELFNHLVVQLLGDDDVGIEELGFPIGDETRVVCFGNTNLFRHGYLPLRL